MAISGVLGLAESGSVPYLSLALSPLVLPLTLSQFPSPRFYVLFVSSLASGSSFNAYRIFPEVPLITIDGFLWTQTDLQSPHLWVRCPLSLYSILYEKSSGWVFFGLDAQGGGRHGKNWIAVPLLCDRAWETCSLHSSYGLKASPAPLKCTSSEIYDEFPVPTPRGSCQGDRLKACIYDKWHFLNKMLIKDHVGFLLFHKLQRLSSECEDHSWVGAPTTYLSLEAVSGSWGEGTLMVLRWSSLPMSGILQAGGYTVGGLKLAIVEIFTPWKWANAMSQGWFFSSAGELVYQDSSELPSLWALCGDDGSWGRSLGLCRGSGQTGGISDLVGENYLIWVWENGIGRGAEK